jgi:molybdopterin synthase catalytic subunit
VSRSDQGLPSVVGDDWLGLLEGEIPIATAYEWVVLPGCGAVVVFSGTVRDHGTDQQGTVREDVHALTYEAYQEQVVPRFAAIVTQLRHQWPATGRVVLWHRLGQLSVGESSVIAVVSAPHRAEAFEAARFAIDALKESAPIWKHEHWRGGSDWALGAKPLVDVAPTATRPTAGG